MKHKFDSLHESVCSLEPLVLYKHIFSECISGESQRTSAVVMLFKRTGWALCFMIIFTVTNRVCGSYGNFTWEHKETKLWMVFVFNHTRLCLCDELTSLFLFLRERVKLPAKRFSPFTHFCKKKENRQCRVNRDDIYSFSFRDVWSVAPSTLMTDPFISLKLTR